MTALEPTAPVTAIAPTEAPALQALLDLNNDDVPDLRAIEVECLQLRYGSLIADTGHYTMATKADGTYRNYNFGLLRMKRFGRAHRLEPFPPSPEFLARHLVAMADKDYSYTALVSDLSAAEALAKALDRGVSASHDYVVRRVLRGVARINGRAPKNQKRAWLPDHTRALLPHNDALALHKPVRASRDLSVLTIGNATGARRASLVGLRTDDIEFLPGGMRVTFRNTKTRQNAGDVHVVEAARIRDERICPFVTLHRYLEAARLDAGFIFRPVDQADQVGDEALHPASINAIVKASARAIGLDPRTFGAHSLRAGMITAGVESGVPVEDIMAVSDHAQLRTLLKYVRPERPFGRDTTARVFA